MRGILLFIAYCAGLATPVSAADRVALLIGNAEYNKPELALANPINDVDALSASLMRIGFDVIVSRDSTRREMLAALDRFSIESQGAEMAIVFYAGHGVQFASDNYLIGVELQELTTQAVTQSSVTLNEIRAAVDAARADLSIIILDACRNNPLVETGVAKEGLAQSRGTVGTLIAYSTDPGNVALDGAGTNSTFTEAMLDHLATPGIDVRIMFGRVRQAVVRETRGLQIPWVEESVLGEHYLVPGSRPSYVDDEVQAWQKAERAGSSDALSGYLDQYPEGLFSQIAQSRIEALNGTGPEPQDEVFAALDASPAVAASLELLGYASATRNAGDAAGTYLAQAFADWQATKRAGAGTVDRLVDEGAQMAVFLGTYTAGVLRKDLQAFLALEENLKLAEQDLIRAQTDFGNDPAAQPVLAEIAANVAAMRVQRDEVAARLDESRSYYHDLINTTEASFMDVISMDLVPRHGATRGGTEVPSRVLDDAQTFLRQLDIMSRAPSGSYAWLTDFLEED
ncbi:caspase family protein (plasmid) [Rhodobacteraceae bacterium SC52]|nr:caspase family protein [Rhodobacteraceae bacterium SC52]